MINATYRRTLQVLFISAMMGCDHADNTREHMEGMRSGYAHIGPLKMYYEVRGGGRTPLVLIHGGGSTIESNWGRIIDILAADRQVIAVELQAHGHTPDVPDRPTSFEQDADDVAGLLAYLKIAKADFFGFSNGGNTAMQ
ncbi:MAG TPA: alpha/beta fold hydrolase, partial [Flavobacteriales bacterium]|nr:alpha/beta fold hydrolase [Flavobacteriales bacterium]